MERSLPIPIRSLQGFTRILLKKGAVAQVVLKLTPDQLITVQADGSSVLTKGTYAVSVGGHQPGDTAGLKVSNTVVATFIIQ
jgi:beta-glucosidase